MRSEGGGCAEGARTVQRSSAAGESVRLEGGVGKGGGGGAGDRGGVGGGGGGGRRDPTGQGGKSSRRENAAWLCFASVGAKGRVRWCAENLPRKDAAEGKREGRG